MIGYTQLTSSSSQDWATPQEFFDRLDAEFHFTLDVCATQENTKCDLFYPIELDGLSQPWEGICWMNPPYGRKIGLWVQHAYESMAHRGAIVVCLLPVRSCTSWWHTYVMKADEIRFIRGRQRFGEAKNTSTFPSAVVVFRHWSGHVVTPRISSILR